MVQAVARKAGRGTVDILERLFGVHVESGRALGRTSALRKG